MIALFTTIGSWLTGFLGVYVFNKTSKFALLGLLIAAYIALYAAFVGSFFAVIKFTPIQPSGNVAAGLALLPDNVFQCVSAIASAHILSHVVLMKSKIIKIASKGA